MTRLFDTSWHPLADGIPPAWASGWGQDRRGVFLEFEVGGVTTSLRWIPPGRFLMGSPDGEDGRVVNEGPQHSVTLSQGFWLMETPCTRELWQAVMEREPGDVGGERALPAHGISWNAVQDFLARVNGTIPGLALTLPTEAQWEHACRAGTNDARYDAPDDIAWSDTNARGYPLPVAFRCCRDAS